MGVRRNTMWGDRTLMIAGVGIALARDEKRWDAICKHLRCTTAAKFVSEGAYATTHVFTSNNGGTVCAVTITEDAHKRFDPITLATLLVHEAVHVWQEHCAAIGDDKPSSEAEAYAVQNIAHTLLSLYHAQCVEDGIFTNS